jgi:hypothetical protein
MWVQQYFFFFGVGYENNEDQINISIVISSSWTKELKMFLNLHNLFYLQLTANYVLCFTSRSLCCLLTSGRICIHVGIN